MLREALIASALSVRDALRWTPGWLIASVAVQLLIALNPAIQVQLVAWLVNTVEHGERAEIWLPLILLSAFAATFTILNAVVSALEQRQSLRLNREYQRRRGLRHCRRRGGGPVHLGVDDLPNRGRVSGARGLADAARRVVGGHQRR